MALRLISVLALSTALGCGSAAIAQTAPAADISVFAAHDDSADRHIDYSVLSDLLHDIVLEVPRMDRIPERAPPNMTGTRITTANMTRYRYEANRVIYHAMSDEYKAAITAYRQELEALPSQIDFGGLSRDEQLAYWFNLHNVAVIEQIMQQYPTTYINRLNAVGTREPLFEARFLNVAGVPLSLNDIRLRIVYAQWDDPRVIYGFFNGAIGSPEIRRDAFAGQRVWRQLDANASDFVNALRGVETDRNELRVSHIYAEAARLFPDFDNDLRTHLRRYATGGTVEQLEDGREVRTDVETWNIADMANGSLRCSGAGGPTPMQISSTYRFRDQAYTASSSPSCADMPSNGQIVLNAVQVRRIELIRSGRYGEVITTDIPTEDPGPSSSLIQRGSSAPDTENE